jgi:hypothetical protein
VPRSRRERPTLQLAETAGELVPANDRADAALTPGHDPAVMDANETGRGESPAILVS